VQGCPHLDCKERKLRDREWECKLLLLPYGVLRALVGLGVVLLLVSRDSINGNLIDPRRRNGRSLGADFQYVEVTLSTPSIQAV
jgi:hypothetical protein